MSKRDLTTDLLPPLCVDLDGTVFKVDTLHESLMAQFLRHPLAALISCCILLVRGRAALKARLSSQHLMSFDLLPVNDAFITWLKHQATLKRPLHLVSAADNAIVEKVAAWLNIFTSWQGSDGHVNLKGACKAAYLTEKFPDGFSYAGDSDADLLVWQKAKTIVIVNARPSVVRRAAKMHIPIEANFSGRVHPFRALLRTFRLHQWVKNILVFIPIILAHHFQDITGWRHAVYAFLALGITASATYIINDVFDLESDRRHPTKRKRALASGDIGVVSALCTVPFLLVIGCGVAAAAGINTLFGLLAYLAMTLAYSFRLKMVPLLDTSIIGLLFTLRVVIGSVATDNIATPWLLAFSVLLFFSLAMAKRQTELAKMAARTRDADLCVRGYQAGDAILSLVYGVTSGVASLVILMLYTTNSVAAGLYHTPYWLWGVPLLIYLWQMRIWLLAHRGILDDDPIVFALKDRLSLGLGLGCIILFYLAL